jgi:hypothetical protein
MTVADRLGIEHSAAQYAQLRPGRRNGIRRFDIATAVFVSAVAAISVHIAGSAPKPGPGVTDADTSRT